MIAISCLPPPRRAAVFLAFAIFAGGLSAALAQCGAAAPALAEVPQTPAAPADRQAAQ